MNSQRVLRLREQYHVLFALIVVLPLAVAVYLAWEHRLLGHLGLDRNTVLFLLVVVLVTAAVSYLRTLLDQVGELAHALHLAAQGKKVEAQIATQIAELKEIEEAFASLYGRYEKANRALEHLIKELAAAKQLAEITYLGMGNLALIQSILEKSMRLLHARSGAVLLYDKHQGSFRRLAVRHAEEKEVPKAWLHYLESIANEVMDCRRAVNRVGIAEDPRWKAEEVPPPASLLALPLGNGPEAIGILALFDKMEGEAFLQEDEIILSILVNEVAGALECSRLKNALQQCRRQVQELRAECARLRGEEDGGKA